MSPMGSTKAIDRPTDSCPLRKRRGSASTAFGRASRASLPGQEGMIRLTLGGVSFSDWARQPQQGRAILRPRHRADRRAGPSPIHGSGTCGRTGASHHGARSFSDRTRLTEYVRESSMSLSISPWVMISGGTNGDAFASWQLIKQAAGKASATTGFPSIVHSIPCKRPIHARPSPCDADL